MYRKRTHGTKARAAILAGALLAVFGQPDLTAQAAKKGAGSKASSSIPQFVKDVINQCPQDTLAAVGTAKMPATGLSRTVAITRAHAEIAQHINQRITAITDMNEYEHFGLEDSAVTLPYLQNITKAQTQATLRNATVAGEDVDTNGAYWVVIMMPKSEHTNAAFSKSTFQSDASSIPQRVKRAVTNAPADALVGIGSARGDLAQARVIARLRAHAQIASQMSVTVSNMVTNTEADNSKIENVTQAKSLDSSTIMMMEFAADAAPGDYYETVIEEYITSRGEKIVIQNNVIKEFAYITEPYLPGAEIVTEGAEAGGVYWCVMTMSKEDAQKALPSKTAEAAMRKALEAIDAAFED